MKVITIKSWETFNAGPKALEDVIRILEKQYKAKSCLIDMATGKIQYKLKLAWNLFLSRFSKEILILQYPIFERKTLLKLANKKRSIVFIHDVEGVRSQDEKLLAMEIEKLSLFSYIVVHNKKMKQILIEKGIGEEKIFILELFDYLCNEEEKRKEDKQQVKDIKDIQLCYAGNLRQEKSFFIYQLTDEMLSFSFHLYGIGAETEKLAKKIKYKGKVEPDDLPNKMQGNLGLIWDGRMDEKDENEYFKNYTKYNNPHKLSCCIAAGMPVVVWEKAAIADFVKKENIGYTVHSLKDINYINLEDYAKKLENVQAIKQRVRTGYYTKRVIQEIQQKME